MLDLEAEYFWKEMSLDVMVDNKERKFKGLKEAVSHAMDDEWNYFVNKYGEYFHQHKLKGLRRGKSPADDYAKSELVE